VNKKTGAEGVKMFPCCQDINCKGKAMRENRLHRENPRRKGKEAGKAKRKLLAQEGVGFAMKRWGESANGT